MLPATLYGFKVGAKLDEGSFGELYKATNLSNNYTYLMKVEKKNATLPQLRYEAKIYKYLHEDKDAHTNGIPRFHSYFEKSNWNCLVLELLGESVEKLFEYSQNDFSMKTVLMLAEEMLIRIEYLHSRGIIHRDIKPGNFVIGKGEKEKKVHILDFGVCKRFISKYGEHIKMRNGKCMVGTARFSSINALKGLEQSRRDDLESLGYTLVYLAKGTLPWIGIPSNSKSEKYFALLRSKEASITGFLCNGLPEEFQQYFDYVRSLEFEQIPDYGFLRKVFRQVMLRNGHFHDKAFDWTSDSKRERGLGSLGTLGSMAGLFSMGSTALNSQKSLGVNSSIIPPRTNTKKGFIRFEPVFLEDKKFEVEKKPNYFMRLVLYSNSETDKERNRAKGLANLQKYKLQYEFPFLLAPFKH